MMGRPRGERPIPCCKRDGNARVVIALEKVGRLPIRTQNAEMTNAAARLHRVSVRFAGPRGGDGGPSRQDRHRSLRSGTHSFHRGPARPERRLESTEARRRRAASHLIEAGPGGRTLLWQGGRFLRGPSALGTSVPALLSSFWRDAASGRRAVRPLASFITPLVDNRGAFWCDRVAWRSELYLLCVELVGHGREWRSPSRRLNRTTWRRPVPARPHHR